MQSKLDNVRGIIQHIQNNSFDPSKARVENLVGAVPVPVGLAGPLHVILPGSTENIYAPLATSEATLVASCSRGCKALSRSGGVHFHVLSEGMSRAAVLRFNSPNEAFQFARELPNIEGELARIAESTGRFVRLQKITPHIIGSELHVHFNYTCGDAAGQNMVTIATQAICAWLLESPWRAKFKLKDYMIEGQMASDKKPSWANVKEPRGIAVVSWASLSDTVCQDVLGLTTKKLYQGIRTLQEGGIRNGQHGSNVNTANMLAAIFIATGQDAGSVAEASWSQLTPDYDTESKVLKLSLYFPSLPVGVVGGGTSLDAQRDALNLLGCAEPGNGNKGRLAGLIASFALGLDISTVAALSNGTFARSHQQFARGPKETAKL
ncbi:substrate-binding domain of hmg-CoA reductase [Aspergillus avenaceus]|uniref:hydroxymethylglutaryl-CoA reductase (NADPH) n=1 Tax=Aspergillus avenaceus TaxID=36643 RepID=A0A5N6U480_ASPAV|nr:substrate-binding domain of hmg-CoA reductase [Aspergillus avenaceus]